MPTKPSYHPGTKSTIPPNHAPGASRLRRFTFRPYAGIDGPSFTLSLYDTGTPGPIPGANYLGFRLYEHTAGTRRGVVVFEAGNWAPETAPIDPTLEAWRILEAHTIEPGSAGDEALGAWAPAQLQFAIRHGAALRAEARRRLAWAPEAPRAFPLVLDAVESARADLRALGRYQVKLGVVTGTGHTRHEARVELGAAIGGQCGMLPQAYVGHTTGLVYVLYPHGSRYVLQTVRTDRPEAPLGAADRFDARSPAEAVEVALATIARLEQPLQRPRAWLPMGRAAATPVRSTVPPPRKRPTARAGAPVAP